MRASTALVVLLILNGCLTGVPSGSEWETAGEDAAQVTESTPSIVVEPDGDRLLSRDDVRAALAESGADPDEYALTLFYVDVDGTWYRVDADGTVGAVAPDGDVVPGIFVENPPGTSAPERIELDASDRPAYVWKVTKTTGVPSTTVVDAETGETLGVWTVPARGGAPPTPV
jgi:hypothetical protein